MFWLKKFADDYGVSTPRGSEDEEEDIDRYLDGEVEIAQYAALTRHNGSAGGQTVVNIYPVYNDLEAAMDRAEAFMDDDIFMEQPFAVVDLQSGILWKANPKVEWQPPEQLNEKG